MNTIKQSYWDKLERHAHALHRFYMATGDKAMADRMLRLEALANHFKVTDLHYTSFDV